MAAETGHPQEQPETHRTVSWRSPEIIGELVLLGLMALLMLAFVISLYRPPFLQDDLPKILLPGRWLPTIVIVIATPLWFIRLYTVLSRRKAIEQGMIMDLGFRLGEDPAGEKRRAALYFGSILGLVAAGVVHRVPHRPAALGSWPTPVLGRARSGTTSP